MRSRLVLSLAEAVVTAAFGSWLGLTAGFLVAGPAGAALGGAIAAINGLAAGYHGIYDWRGVRGWLAFAADSTWGLLGTTLGVVLLVANLGTRRAMTIREQSRRCNRHVHDGGLALKPFFALTLGNIISNANPRGRGVNPSFLSRHEELHIWQSRAFGPLFPLTYALWWAGGVVVGTVVWLFHRDESWRRLVETAAYYDNPFEYWAYRNDENWPPAGAHPLLAWRK